MAEWIGPSIAVVVVMSLAAWLVRRAGNAVRRELKGPKDRSRGF